MNKNILRVFCNPWNTIFCKHAQYYHKCLGYLTTRHVNINKKTANSWLSCSNSLLERLNILLVKSSLRTWLDYLNLLQVCLRPCSSLPQGTLQFLTAWGFLWLSWKDPLGIEKPLPPMHPVSIALAQHQLRLPRGWPVRKWSQAEEMDGSGPSMLSLGLCCLYWALCWVLSRIYVGFYYKVGF